MYNGLLHAHSGWRWVALILLIAAIAQAFSNNKNDVALTKESGKVVTFAMIALHIQFLFGLILLFISPKVDFGNMMADSATRFYTLEHTVMMLAAVALVTIGRKKGKAAGTFKPVFKFYLIALVIILAAIPWPFRELGAGWF